MTASTQGAGRTVVDFHDDGGRPYRFPSSSVSILGQSQMTDVVALPLTPDAGLNPPRPPLVEGQILLTAQVVFDPVAVQYALADLQVVGFVGSTETIIWAGMLGGDAQSVRVRFRAEDTFDKISVRGREIVNGQPSSDSTNVTQMNISAVAYMWSS